MDSIHDMGGMDGWLLFIPSRTSRSSTNTGKAACWR